MRHFITLVGTEFCIICNQIRAIWISAVMLLLLLFICKMREIIFILVRSILEFSCTFVIKESIWIVMVRVVFRSVRVVWVIVVVLVVMTVLISRLGSCLQFIIDFSFTLVTSKGNRVWCMSTAIVACSKGILLRVHIVRVYRVAMAMEISRRNAGIGTSNDIFWFSFIIIVIIAARILSLSTSCAFKVACVLIVLLIVSSKIAYLWFITSLWVNFHGVLLASFLNLCHLERVLIIR